MFTTPAGNPRTIYSPSLKTVSGAQEGGFSTTVFPVISAGASLETAVTSGKFGVISPPRQPAPECHDPCIGVRAMVRPVMLLPSPAIYSSSAGAKGISNLLVLVIGPRTACLDGRKLRFMLLIMAPALRQLASVTDVCGPPAFPGPVCRLYGQIYILNAALWNNCRNRVVRGIYNLHGLPFTGFVSFPSIRIL